MSSTERSLVIGAYTGLPARLVEPFAQSLRTAGFNGRFVVLAGLCGPEEKEQLRSLADDVVDLDAEYASPPGAMRHLLSFLRSTRGFRGHVYPLAFQALARGSFRRWSNLEYNLEGLQSLRYRHYRDYLAALDPEPDVVMLTDLRDVVFQRDPFAEPVSGLELYLEDDSVRIGDEPFNTRWIRNLYGAAELDRLRDRRVSCSGTVVGTRAGVLQYLDEMISEIAPRRRPMGSHDQGVHNALLQHGRFDRLTVVANGRGRVLTMGKMTSYETGPDGTVLNADGSIPAVLHQWDRHGDTPPRRSQTGA